MPLIVFNIQEIPVSPEIEARWLGELPAARRAHLLAWPDDDARRRSLLGTRLLRAGLLRLGYPADALSSLSYSRHGKPTTDLPLAFSLAHCAGHILCAISTEGPIGVDIEPLATVAPASSRLYLSPREREWVSDSAQRFVSLWTQKEAVVKAGGTRGLRQMHEFEMAGHQTTFAGHRWYTSPLHIHKDFVAHLAHSQAWPGDIATPVTLETLM